jgi:hypothetical protein
MYDIDLKDSLNRKTYYTISIMHQLFTTTGANDGSRGEILNMPYFWHYNTPNPRRDILVNGKKNIAYCTIERKPHNFLGDMVSQNEKFTHPEFGSFSSFGWCSEREMAFACLTGSCKLPWTIRLMSSDMMFKPRLTITMSTTERHLPRKKLHR